MLVRRETKILVGILILAIFLRGVNLNQHFIGDEIGHVTAGKAIVEEGSLRTLDFSKGIRENNLEEYFIPGESPFRPFNDHPPFGIMLFALFALLPFSLEISLRLLPLTGGILAIILTYLIGKEIFNERIGLIAAFLGSISTYQIFHSSFILESDAIMNFLIPLSFFIYLKWTRNREEKMLFYLIGISLGLIILTKVTGLIFLGFILFYELIQRRFRDIAGLLIIIGSMVGIWVLYDYLILTDISWVDGVLEHGLLTGEGMSLFQRIYGTAYGTGILIEELTPPLVVISILVFLFIINSVIKELSVEGGGPSKFKKVLFRSDIMLLLWVLLNSVYFLNGGGGDPQRYFGIAVPFLFILVAEFISKFRLDKIYMAISTIMFLAICYLVQVNDYQFYTYFIYKNNAVTLFMWSLPFLFLFFYFIKNFRETVISILIGSYLGFSLYFIIFSSNSWPIAISQTTEYVAQDKESTVIVSKSWYVLESAMYYDWMKDGKLDKKYFGIPLNEIKNFDEKNKDNCRKMVFGGYPLVFLCK